MALDLCLFGVLSDPSTKGFVIPAGIANHPPSGLGFLSLHLHIQRAGLVLGPCPQGLQLGIWGSGCWLAEFIMYLPVIHRQCGGAQRSEGAYLKSHSQEAAMLQVKARKKCGSVYV